MPNLGDKVHVWPHSGMSVRPFAELHDRRLPPEGMDLPWSPWLEELYGQGAIHLTDPAPKPAPAAVTNKKPEG
jgi:hypothetical protein